jgi:adenylosuccinate lyase
MLEFEKYILPEMRAIWEKEERYTNWLEVEIAVLEAKEELTLIPLGIAAKTRTNARFTVKDIDEEDRRIDQEMVAFLNVVRKSLPVEVLPFLHGGLTSFDVWDTGRALQMKKSNSLIREAAKDLIEILRSVAKTYMYAAMTGRTHGIHAEPITFGLKVLNWADELERQLENLEKRESELFVGKISGATGNYGNIDPRIEEIVCKKLGIQSAKISNQIVSRDRHYTWLTMLASINNSLEKFATNVRLLQQTEISEVQESSTEEGGSSAMPWKRNPNKSERICSLARLPRVFTVVAGENQALQWHERSLDESANERVIISLTAMFTYYNLRLFTEVMAGLKVNTEKMIENLLLTKGAIFSEDVMLSLANKGMARDKARLIVREDSLKAWDNKLDFREVLKSDPRVTVLLSLNEIDACFSYQHYLKNIDQIFARFGI